MLKIHNLLNKQALTQTDKIDLAENLAILLRDFPDLAAVISKWPSLSTDRREAIIAKIDE